MLTTTVPDAPTPKQRIGQLLRRVPWLYRAAKDFERSARFLRRQPMVAARALLARRSAAQKPRTLRLALTELSQLTRIATLAGTPASPGGHAIYFPPEALRHAVFGNFFDVYPATVGLKILQNVGAPSKVDYLTSRSASYVRNRTIGSLEHHLRVANYLWSRDIAPRAWDVIELRLGEASYSALVVEHITGYTAGGDEQQQFLARLESVLADGIVDLAVDDRASHLDFTPKGLEANLIVHGPRAVFIDTQNFVLRDPQGWAKQVAGDSTGVLHFGEQRLGANILYQSVPGVHRRAKRDVETRFDRYRRELAALGIDFTGRAVLDVGCNGGMIMRAALAEGAEWAIGWDLPDLASAAGQLLLSLGMTRFDVFGGELTETTAMRGRIRDALAPLMPESIVFYLAVHGHIGWNADLLAGPWRALVVEGHQNDNSGDIHGIATKVRELAGGDVELRAFEINDNDSLRRPALVAVRK